MVKLGEIKVDTRDEALTAFADDTPRYKNFRAHVIRIENGDKVYGVYAVKKKRTSGY